MEIILGKERRRWSEDQKRALVAETFVGGETVNGVARRHSVSSSMLFGWRKQYREGLGFPAPVTPPIAKLIGFAAVSVAPPTRCEPAAPPLSSACIPLIELELGRGTRMRIFGAVDPGLAVAVMKAMPRR